MKYSDQITEWLIELGYTHCFLVGGGNIMHLIESISKRMICIPVIHEVAAGIATEYYNETSPNGSKAFSLVTAGPGLTNIVTALAGAYLESRELLVIGGQVKTSDLARNKLRQRGIQEIDGLSIVRSITIRSRLIDEVIDANSFSKLISHTNSERRGPIFLEIPLDIQAKEVSFEKLELHQSVASESDKLNNSVALITEKLNTSKRPVILIGGGVLRQTAKRLQKKLAMLNIPIMTTWNAADRIDSGQSNYFGRPNTWGQRSSNLIIQQSDFLLAIGTRLGLQQTGFNWQEFIPNGEIAQIDIDKAELSKGHPEVQIPILEDANIFLEKLFEQKLGSHLDWMAYAKSIRKYFPLSESFNTTESGYISPFHFVSTLSKISSNNDIVVPCSSGGAFTTMMQAFNQKMDQIIVTNKGLASMGYGLSGAIGAALANRDKRVILVEGDGGFAQNLQEIGTAQLNKLNLKIFIFDDKGYASIRMTQKNYFHGRYVGCDTQTGLGMPNWEKLFSAWSVPVLKLDNGFEHTSEFIDLFEEQSTVAFIVPIDPNQTYFPKIMSRISDSGAMESNPLHMMYPEITEEERSIYLKYLNFIK
ncbi:acetolactate synthase large subunit [Polynucleobacter sp. HIN8]|uniref:thiamine pyrophosphate-binding protein n=1 Tax=Polynucleobacter sp. HIN8 TaxID=3047867 RepID=UPI0025743CEC|nr:thiamine pyrophosphate-binding protein [Polynucleobacter sp. HIN8]BEI38373.1 acetolactate synthase large subunit [Polynucleobacter sp. HIN8]